MRLFWKKFRYQSLVLMMLALHSLAMFMVLEQDTSKDSAPTARLKVKIIDELSQKKQIVQSEESDSTIPQKDSYLSDKDRSFDRQTLARKVNIFKRAAKGGGQSQKSKQDLKLSDLGSQPGEMHPLQKAAIKQAEQQRGIQHGEGDELISSTNDHVEDIPPGDLTHLNSIEYKYYGFYHRIRQKLEQFWGRSIQEKAELMASEGRSLAASEEHITALQITMDGRGRILSIHIINTSGVRELDEAAISSFNEAGPFPNPPRDLVRNGRVTLEWGFVVKT